MRRREVVIALTVAVVAGLLMAMGIGAIIALGTGQRATDNPTAADPGTPLAASTPHIPVLCYHYVRSPGGPLHFLRVFGYVVLSLPLLDDSQLWNVSASGFRRQMEYLVERGYHAVTLDDVHEWQLGRRELPPRPVVITFDDGDASVYEEAFPILQELGLRATMFLVTARVGSEWGNVNCLDWPTLRAMRQSGVFTFESHTDDLHYKIKHQGDVLPVFIAASERAYDIGDGWQSAIYDDLMRSRLAIELNLGRSPSYLAWPYGFGNPALDRLAAQAGFRRTLALRAATNLRFADQAALDADPSRYEIPRYAVTARTSLRDFRAMLEGTYRPGG